MDLSSQSATPEDISFRIRQFTGKLRFEVLLPSNECALPGPRKQCEERTGLRHPVRRVPHFQLPKTAETYLEVVILIGLDVATVPAAETAATAYV
jgi:hypothetical protein